MSDDTPTEKKLPLRRRFLPTTLAGKSAAATAIALVLILIVVWMLRLFGAQSVRLIHAVTVPHMIIELLLVILIPTLLYWGMRRWNQVIEGEYPDIDRAWEAGIRALEAKGVSPSDYPIFLILGSAGAETEQSLMEALDTELSVHGVPEAAGVSHALQWYMSSEAIYLFCPGASALSALMGRWSPSSMNVGSGGSAARRVTAASNRTAGDASTPRGAATADASSNKIGIPKIERAAKPVPTQASAATPEPVALKKESSLAAKPPQPSPQRQTPAPQSYLGTIGHQAIDSSPQSDFSSGAAPQESPTPRPRGSAFDTPPPKRPPSTGSAPSDEALRPAPRFEGTISLDQYSSRDGDETNLPSGRPQRAGGAPNTNEPETAPVTSAPTGSAGEPGTTVGQKNTASRKSSGAPLAMPLAGGNKKVALPASLDTSDQLPRLQYVCKLLKRARRPMCGINGAVTLIPFELSRVGPLQLSAIAQSARGDIETVQQTLGVRSPVTAVLVGLEQDKGFTELVRRLQSGLLSRRLGGRFDLRSRPTPNELNTHSDRLCDAFEDWVYRLFSREDGLAQQRGNRKLYALTCKIRHELKPRLRIVLGQAFGCQPSENDSGSDNDDSFFFSGCYFAATGAATGQPAFVKGVLRDKLTDEQSKVEWTEESRRQQRSLTLLTIIGWVLALAFTAMLIIRHVFFG